LWSLRASSGISMSVTSCTSGRACACRSALSKSGNSKPGRFRESHRLILRRAALSRSCTWHTPHQADLAVIGAHLVKLFLRGSRAQSLRSHCCRMLFQMTASSLSRPGVVGSSDGGRAHVQRTEWQSMCAADGPGAGMSIMIRPGACHQSRQSNHVNVDDTGVHWGV